MGGKKDKKKKSNKDPEKKAALAAKKEAKADKASLKRLQKEKDRLNSLSLHDSDHDVNDGHRKGSSGGKGGDDLDAILESYRNRTKELSTAEFEVVDTPFPCPPRGNFTWTLCPANSMFYTVSYVLKHVARYSMHIL